MEGIDHHADILRAGQPHAALGGGRCVVDRAPSYGFIGHAQPAHGRFPARLRGVLDDARWIAVRGGRHGRQQGAGAALRGHVQQPKRFAALGVTPGAGRAVDVEQDLEVRQADVRGAQCGPDTIDPAGLASMSWSHSSIWSKPAAAAAAISNSFYRYLPL